MSLYRALKEDYKRNHKKLASGTRNKALSATNARIEYQDDDDEEDDNNHEYGIDEAVEVPDDDLPDGWIEYDDGTGFIHTRPAVPGELDYDMIIGDTRGFDTFRAENGGNIAFHEFKRRQRDREYRMWVDNKHLKDVADDDPRLGEVIDVDNELDGGARYILQEVDDDYSGDDATIIAIEDGVHYRDTKTKHVFKPSTPSRPSAITTGGINVKMLQERLDEDTEEK